MNNKYHFKYLTAQGRWVNENLEIVNPYLISKAREKRFCGFCRSRTAFRPTLDPNCSEEYCPNCGKSLGFMEAPEDFKVAKDIGNYARVDEIDTLPVQPVTIAPRNLKLV